MTEPAVLDVVEPDDGHVLRHPQPPLVRRVQGAERQFVTEREHRVRLGAGVEQFGHRPGAVAPVQRRHRAFPRETRGDPGAPERRTVPLGAQFSRAVAQMGLKADRGDAAAAQ